MLPHFARNSGRYTMRGYRSAMLCGLLLTCEGHPRLRNCNVSQGHQNVFFVREKRMN